MVRKYLRNFIIVLLILTTGWYIWRRGQIHSVNDFFAQLKKDSNDLITSIRNVRFSKPSESLEKIRIATFDLTDFSDQKLEKKVVQETLVRLISRFDLIAIQGIQSRDHDALPRLMDALREIDPRFDYVIGPRSSHTAIHHQFAFIYNRRTLEIERDQVYSIQDPDDVIAHDPLVAWFRVKAPDPENAFTFSMVNLRIDPSNRKQELKLLKQICLAVKQDGHQEDDILLAGNFQLNSITLENSRHLPGYDYVITQDPTDLLGTRQLSNIAFPVRASGEFTGRAGVLDFLSEFNLSLDDAKLVSEHLPVWGEFMVHEGAATGYVASVSR